MKMMRNILVEKLEGEITLRRSRHGEESNDKIDLKGVGCAVMDWIKLAKVRSSG
jgi:hypothetical protein